MSGVLLGTGLITVFPNTLTLSGLHEGTLNNIIAQINGIYCLNKSGGIQKWPSIKLI